MSVYTGLPTKRSLGGHLRVFRILVTLFRNHLFENDALTIAYGSEMRAAQVLGILAVPGLLVSMYLLPEFMNLQFRTGPEVRWQLRTVILFFVAYSFAVTGFVTVFKWDLLFPDRHDFLALSPLPIRMRDLFASKLAVLGLFLAAVAICVNGGSVILLPVFSMFNNQAHAAGVLNVALGQIAACGAAAVFGFFAISALHGTLVNLLRPSLFRRISPFVQMITMSSMVLSVLLFPIYSGNMHSIAVMHPGWLVYFPPYWFVGIYEWFLPEPDPVLKMIGIHGLRAIGVAITLFCVVWIMGYARYHDQTLESRYIAERRSRVFFKLYERIRSGFLNSPEERAVFQFTGQTLMRSSSHRLFLTVYLSVGVSFGLLATLTVGVDPDGLRLSTSPEGLRVLPFLLEFVVISGLRAAFQFPAELSANWIFQLADTGWAQASLDATRKRVWVSGMLPIVISFFPVEIVTFGLGTATFHLIFQSVAGMFLIEGLFWRFDKVPFTCSYFPGKVNLALLAGLYLYGFTSYSFTMADLERFLETGFLRSVVFLLVSIAVLRMILRNRQPNPRVRFDAYEPEFQTLDLT